MASLPTSCLCAALLAGLTLPARAQAPDPAGEGEFRARLGSLRGDAARWSLLREGATPAGSGLHLLPVAWRVVRNSALPYSANAGALWAGRGAAALVSGGAAWRRGAVTVVVAPSVTWSENRAFSMPDTSAPDLAPGRHPLSAPWYGVPLSADVPLRFGTGPYRRLSPGQSSLTVVWRGVALGLSSENRWWGPGRHNALLLSTNAEGFVHGVLRPAAPVRTGAGTFDARWLVGGLAESAWFDSTAANDRRALSALAVTWSPPGTEDVTLGVARAVYRPVARWSAVPGRLFDALVAGWRRPNDLPRSDSSQTPGPDQLLGLFGRWAFPASGVAVYGEWARAEVPRSLGDLLASPNHSQGYTLGFEWARPVARTGAVQLAAEHTWLEQSPTVRDRPQGTWYASRAVAQGYTHRGQVLGAAIGPGASSQHLSADLVQPTWRAGVVLGRIRWNNDALFQLPNDPPLLNTWCSHDVSLLASLRGAARVGVATLEGSLTAARRRNLWFQNYDYCATGTRPELVRVVRNTTLELRATIPMP